MLKRAKLSLKDLKNIKKVLPGEDPVVTSSKELRKVIPVCEPSLVGNELKYIKDCIKSNWISSVRKGYVEKFEEKFAHLCGVKYAVSCTSGTSALHLALAALGIKKDDEVIIPTFTMIATANAVTYLGAKPVLVDSESATWNIDADQIEEKITSRTKAIIVVHTYGHPAKMDKIMNIARRHKLYVVEDAAEAHGALYKKRKVGSIGDVATFSFYANKIVTTGEGGMLTTNNKKIARIVLELKNHAFSKERHFWHQYLGYNYRLTNLQAAIGVAQLERFDKLSKARIKNAKYYNFLLKNIKGITLPPETEYVKNAYWMYSILIDDDFGVSRDKLRRCLAQDGIETRTFFIPIHLQPIYFKMYKERFPISEDLCRKGMYLPSAATLTKRDIEFIVRCVRSVAGVISKRKGL